MEYNHLEKLLRLKNNFSVKIITGARGTGKTTLLKNFVDTLRSEGVDEREIILIDCAADEQLKNFNRLYELVDEKSLELDKFFLLIDNADCVVGCEKTINALFVGAPAEIYLTASSDCLAEKISALLPNNCDVLKIYPPSLADYAKNFPAEDSAKLLQDYLNCGSSPVTIGASENFMPTILRGLAYEIMFDAMAKNSLQKADLLRMLMRLVAKNVGKPVTLNQLATKLNDFNFSPNVYVLKNYLHSASEFFVKIPCLDLKTGNFLRGIEKIYFVDNGLLRALRNFDDLDETTLIENAVCIELLRRGYRVSFGRFGTMNVKFVGERDGKKIFVQILPAAGNISARRITRPLRALTDDAEKILISTHSEKISDGITNLTPQNFLAGS